MKTDCLECGIRRMGANGLCGKCSKERVNRVMADIKEKRERAQPEPSGQTGISDWT